MQDARHTIIFPRQPRIISTSTIVGRREMAGELGNFFHHQMPDEMFAQDTFEKAERRMLQFVLADAVKNAPEGRQRVDLIFSGDLMNQIVSSAYAARKYSAGFCGLYNACATMAEAFALAAMTVDGGYLPQAACCTGSHFGSAERQFRFPLELGTQRTPTSQWTVTGAGAALIGDGGNFPRITSACFGNVVDYGIKDANNMGAAMAPAARETIDTYFKESGEDTESFDLVLTGDLGRLGNDILRDLLKEKGLSFGSRLKDCGAMIYSETEKDDFQGGSGAGCSASIVNSYIYKQLQSQTLKKVLFIATGALHSPMSTQQGDSIPCVAHAVCLEA